LVIFDITYSHPDLVHEPVVLFNLKHFDCIIDLLLGTPEETTEGVNELVVYGAR
jgi:hypothetical protein